MLFWKLKDKTFCSLAFHKFKNPMKTLLKLIFLGNILLFIWGFYTQTYMPKRGALLIGIAVVIMAFVNLPLFLYTRYKDKKLSEYIFPSKPPQRENTSKED